MALGHRLVLVLARLRRTDAVGAAAWPKDRLRSDTYWRIVALDRRYQLSARYDRLRRRPRREAIVQDIEVPINRASEFHDFFVREIGIAPVWACPLRQRSNDVTWDLYSLDPSKRYVNFGFWSSVPLQPGESDGTYNRRIEAKVEELDGRKSLQHRFLRRGSLLGTLWRSGVQVPRKMYDPTTAADLNGQMRPTEVTS